MDLPEYLSDNLDDVDGLADTEKRYVYSTVNWSMVDEHLDPLPQDTDKQPCIRLRPDDIPEHVELRHCDKAEEYIDGQLHRYWGWNGTYFEHHEIINSEVHSLRYSIIYEWAFSIGPVAFYKMLGN